MRLIQKRNTIVLALAILTICFVVSCKEWVSPHRAPAKNEVDLLLAAYTDVNTMRKAQESTAAGAKEKNDGMSDKTVITVNMVPRPDHPAEMEALTREVELFENSNKDVKIQISMWQYSPENFMDRARTRTLPDVVEVSVSQMPAIIDMSYAVDISNDLLKFPDYQYLRPEIMQLCMKDGCIYAVPTDLHTMALFYNRRMFTAREAQKKKAATPPAPVQDDKTSDRKKTKKNVDSKNKGGNESAEYLVAQVGYYGEQPRRRGLFSRIFGIGRRQDQEEYYQQQQQQYYNQQADNQEQEMNVYDETAGPEPLYNLPSQYIDSDIESAVPSLDLPPTALLTPESAESVEANKRIASIDRHEKVTTISETYKLPTTWDELAKTAVEFTDHKQQKYGYVPNCIAYEGGRELAQWAVLSGVNQIEYKSDDKILSELNTTRSVAALTWMRELRTKYDVTPPVSHCYSDNLMKMFAAGNIAMLCLPANRNTFERLQRNGMPINDIGVAQMPVGPISKGMLVEGTCLMLNSQTNSSKRNAALRWIMFQHDPRRLQLNARILSKERELVGVPRVPLYTDARQDEIDALIAPYREIAQFVDYEKGLYDLLVSQPAWFKKSFYETFGKDLYRFLEKDNADVVTTAEQLGHDFMNSSLSVAPTSEERLKMQLKEFVESASREFKNVRAARKNH